MDCTRLHVDQLECVVGHLESRSDGPDGTIHECGSEAFGGSSESNAGIRLTGTAKGLGTALVDGTVRTVGTRFEVSDYTFELIDVEAGAIHLAVVENNVFGGWRCIVNREGATLLAEA